jgi:hypothetical protein
MYNCTNKYLDIYIDIYLYIHSYECLYIFIHLNLFSRGQKEELLLKA